MEIQKLKQRIFDIRGMQVMLDFDLAELYGMETKVLKQAVKRNIDRFPEDFMFQLSEIEWQNLRSQIVTSSWGGSRYLPMAFTEQGVAMLSSVLNSPKAVQTNIAIMRTFVAIRHFTLSYAELEKKVNELEKTFNKKFKDVFEVLDYLYSSKKKEESFKAREPIGFIKPKKNSTPDNKLKKQKR
jgi:hypothetical protein